MTDVAEMCNRTADFVGEISEQLAHPGLLECPKGRSHCEACDDAEQTIRQTLVLTWLIGSVK